MTEIISKVQIETFAKDGTDASKILAMFKNKSEAMRQLYGMGFTTSQIAKMLNVRYQFVNNVKTEMLRKK